MSRAWIIMFYIVWSFSGDAVICLLYVQLQYNSAVTCMLYVQLQYNTAVICLLYVQLQYTTAVTCSRGLTSFAVLFQVNGRQESGTISFSLCSEWTVSLF